VRVTQQYFDLFQYHLEMKLREGGPAEYMVAIARMYAQEDSILRDYAFREWLNSGQEVECHECDSRFAVKAAETIEWHEVLCECCLSDKRNSPEDD
jgi:hypothetical protein